MNGGLRRAGIVRLSRMPYVHLPIVQTPVALHLALHVHSACLSPQCLFLNPSSGIGNNTRTFPPTPPFFSFFHIIATVNSSGS